MISAQLGNIRERGNTPDTRILSVSVEVQSPSKAYVRQATDALIIHLDKNTANSSSTASLALETALPFETRTELAKTT